MFVGLKCLVIFEILILCYRCKVVRLLLDTRTLAWNREIEYYVMEVVAMILITPAYEDRVDVVNVANQERVRKSIAFDLGYECIYFRITTEVYMLIVPVRL